MELQQHSILYHVHDPMCSWCWGFRKVWEQLRAALPEPVTVVNVVGGLAPDTDQSMPQGQQKTIAGYWHDVADRTGAEFNFDFWRKCQPRRSTYPACRAVLAASRQGAEQAMIDAIQRAYYLRAMNPSDNSTLVTLAGELELNENQFAKDLASPDIQAALEQDFALRRQLRVYSFPSLVFAQGDQLFPIELNYQTHEASLAAIRFHLG